VEKPLAITSEELSEIEAVYASVIGLATTAIPDGPQVVHLY